MKIGAVVQWTSQDIRFLGAQVRELRRFTNDIVYTVYDHFFDGQPEDLKFVEAMLAKVSGVRWAKLTVDKGTSRWKLHRDARVRGARILETAGHSDLTGCLMIDGDEIPDGARMRDWIATKPKELVKCRSVRFASHWYFRTPTQQAVQSKEHGPLYVNYSVQDPLSAMMGIKGDRTLTGGPDVTHLLRKDPMWHHFSWVGTKERLQRKAATFAHAGDRDWNAMLDEEFSKPNSGGQEPVHGYPLVAVANRFGI